MIHSIFIKEKIKKLRNQTPFFIFSKEILFNNIQMHQKGFPINTEICYAMKANSENIVLKNLNSLKLSFEVASKYELALLKKIKVPANRIIYGTSVKPESHIKFFVKYGVDRFALIRNKNLLRLRVARLNRVYIFV